MFEHLKQLFTLKAHNEAQTLKYKQSKLIYSLIDVNSTTYFIALGTCIVL